MRIRESVKQLLRMCGHAAVSTVHDRLNVIEAELQDGLNTHTALLQSNIHLVQAAPALGSEIRERVASLAEEIRANCAVIQAEFRDGLNTHTALLQTSIDSRLAEEIRTNCAQRPEVQAIRDELQDLKQHLRSLETKFDAVRASVERSAAQTIDFLDTWEKVPNNRDYDNAFKVEWELFIRHLYDDTPFRWNLLEGAKGVQLAELGLKSWAERRWLDVPALKA